MKLLLETKQSEAMRKTTYIINVVTEAELNNEQKTELLADFRNRLQGYTTHSPEYLRGAKITITRQLSNDDIMQSIRNNE